MKNYRSLGATAKRRIRVLRENCRFAGKGRLPAATSLSRQGSKGIAAAHHTCGLRTSARRLCQAFTVQRFLNAGPHPRTGVFHRHKQLGAFRYVAQVGHQVRADRTALQVSLFFFTPAAIDNVWQHFLKLRTGHNRSLSLSREFAAALFGSRPLCLPYTHPATCCSFLLFASAGRQPSPPGSASAGRAASFAPCGAATCCCRWNIPSSQQSHCVHNPPRRATQR
jgi:hypothetical protein